METEQDVLKLLDGGADDIRRYVTVRRLQFDAFIERMEAKFTPEKVKTMVVSILNERIALVGKLRERCYVEYGELRKNGVPYAKRRELLDTDKILRCDREEARLVVLSKSFKVRKWGEFLKDGDQWSMKRVGLRSFINLFLEEIVC